MCFWRVAWCPSFEGIQSATLSVLGAVEPPLRSMVAMGPLRGGAIRSLEMVADAQGEV